MTDKKDDLLEDEIVLTDEQKMTMTKAFIAPLVRPMYYALRGKLLAYSMGIEVDISEDEWKQAEELGFVDPIKEQK